MKAYFADEQRRHDPKSFLSSGAPKPNPEVPERVERLLAGAKAAGCTIERPKSIGLGPIAAIHSPEYIEFLQHIHQRWQRIVCSRLPTASPSSTSTCITATARKASSIGAPTCSLFRSMPTRCASI